MFYFLFLKDVIYLFLERGEGKEREGEKHQCVIAPYWGLASDPGMCPDWELNCRLFGSQPMLSPLSHSSQGRTQQSGVNKDSR